MSNNNKIDSISSDEILERWANVHFQLEKFKEDNSLSSIYKKQNFVENKYLYADYFVTKLLQELEKFSPEKILEEIIKIKEYSCLKRKKTTTTISSISSVCLFRFELDNAQNTNYLDVLEEIIIKHKLSWFCKIKLYVYKKKNYETQNINLIKMFELKKLLIQLQYLECEPYLFVCAVKNRIIVGIGIKVSDS